ncbi:class I SAM-dependent methyltransferase [Roseobacter sp. YSTF-M11]|uniref:Class I SAM-dependent methyltransferase n=1 Tax=Roseobacter insulae TaxID=2859783 RepID=A0A9X1JZ75_9RHOB|nr:methyltransferase domain-containing protein [Roseobacter insulae]MBW4709066.1 class I SAM-dependent methyltransferase [Roseobacter insulae]
MNTPSAVAFDETRAEAFANRLVGTLNEAALALMTSLGHRTALFDVLSAAGDVTSKELADRAGLSERYVREWLGVMVTAGVAEYAAAPKTYRLPAEHAAFLTRAASPNNIAVTSQFIGVSAAVEEEMLARFKDGAGTHYHNYCRFHAVMAEDSAQTVVAALTDQILPLVPGLAARLENGINVADVGCGGGRAMLALAREFPASTFTGFDLCGDAFAETEATARRLNLSNLTFRQQDLSQVTSLGTFDLVTAFDAVHDQKDPQGLLHLVSNSMAEGGVFLMQDIGGSRDLETNKNNPFAPLLYTISLMHCTPISIGQGGPGLGTMWGVETAHEYLEIAGFGQVETHRLPHDPINAYFVARH